MSTTTDEETAIPSLTEPTHCPHCLADYASVRGTEDDVIGIFSLQRDFVMAWRCPKCGHEWSRL